MFKNITDPNTKEIYSISSHEGKSILEKYITNIADQEGGATAQSVAWGVPSRAPPGLPPTYVPPSSPRLAPTRVPHRPPTGGTPPRLAPTRVPPRLPTGGTPPRLAPTRVPPRPPARGTLRGYARSVPSGVGAIGGRGSAIGYIKADVTIHNPPAAGPQKGYLETFCTFNTPSSQPRCENHQLDELNILIGAVNSKLLEDQSGTHATDPALLGKLKNQKEKLQKLNKTSEEDTTLITSMLQSHSSTAIVAEFNRAKKALINKKLHIQTINDSIKKLQMEINDKSGLASTQHADRDLVKLARLKYELNESDTVTEKTDLKNAKKELITELIKSTSAKIATEMAKINKEKKKIYISGIDTKCILGSSTNTLEINNLDLKYGNSTTDRGAQPVTMEVTAVPNNPYLLQVIIENKRTANVIHNLKIMIPKSIFILNLSNLINTNDEVFQYIEASFLNTANNTNNSYFTTFIEYILSFADNLIKENIDQTQIYRSGNNILGVLNKTYHINDSNEKHNVVVKVTNFQNFGDSSESDKITIDLQMAIIPSYQPRAITIKSGTNDIIIKDYNHNTRQYKTYGILNFLNEKTKILDDYVLGLATPSWCPLF